MSKGMSYERVVATCSTSAGKDVSCLAITSGAAVRWARYDMTGWLLTCTLRRRWADWF
jgi:endonuclease YncB( thermonuclease family)